MTNGWLWHGALCFALPQTALPRPPRDRRFGLALLALATTVAVALLLLR